MTTPSTSQQRPLLLMLGDSLVADFNWQDRMGQFTVVNHGVPGATTADLLASLEPLVESHAEPAIIMVMIGTNDLVMENFAFTAELKQSLVLLSQGFPGTEILVNSLLPMRLPHLGQEAIGRINQQIEVICRETGSCYLNVHDRFQGQHETELFQADKVHLTAAGYGLWARTILEHIAFLVEND